MTNLDARIDAFTDTAFAFAVSLMIVGVGGQALGYAGLCSRSRMSDGGVFIGEDIGDRPC